MLNNPDPSIRDEAALAITAADAAIEAARAAEQKAIEEGATGKPFGIDISGIGAIGFDEQQLKDFLNGGDDDAVFGNSYGVLGDNLKRAIDSFTSQGNEADILNTKSDITAPVVVLAASPDVDGATLDPSYTNYEPGTVTYTFIDAKTGEVISNTGLQDGSYDIIVIATDQAGNTSSTEFKFTLATGQYSRFRQCYHGYGIRNELSD